MKTKNIILKGDEKILIVPPFGMGDNIMFLPAAYNLKMNFPKLKIHFLSARKNGALEVIKLSPYVDKVIEFKLKEYTILNYIKFYLFYFLSLIIKIKLEKYDYILTIKPNLLRKTILYIFPKEKKILDLNSSTNQIDSGIKLLNNFKNLNIVKSYPRLINFSSNEKKILNKFNLKKSRYVLTNFYGKYSYKTWLHGRWFINSLDKKLIKNIKLVLIGVNKDHLPMENILDLTNKTSLEEAIVLIKNSLLFVTVDGGLMHIAFTQNTPSISLFGSVNSKFLVPSYQKSYLRIFDGADKYSWFGKNKDNVKNYLSKINRKFVLDETLHYIKIHSK